VVLEVGKSRVDPQQTRFDARRAILRKALQDPESEVRAAAAHAMEFLESEVDGVRLEAGLASDVVEERLKAVHGLAGLPNGFGAPKIVCALRDPAEAVRVAAAKSLGELRELRTLEPLAAALEDTSRNVRLAAIEALGCFANRRLVPLMLVLLQEEQDPETIVAILHAIGTTREPSVEKQIADYCGHVDARVRAAAVEALGVLE